MKSVVFSLEALFTITAMVFLASHVLIEPSVFHGEVRDYQLVQDLLEVTVKNPELKEAAIQFHYTGQSNVLREKYGRAISLVGDYCLQVKSGNWKTEVNCRTNSFQSTFSASRVLFDGISFFEFTVSLRLNQ